jgi:Holliday junction resolvase RusA-like endonuclease
MSSLTFLVHGVPVGAGSKHGFAVKKNGQYTGKVAMVDTSRERGKDWRQSIVSACFDVMHSRGITPFNEPVIIRASFIFPRPKSHYRTGRYKGILRDNAPAVHSSKPDIDKVLRSLLDALTFIAIRDDSLICEIHAYKSYSDTPGARITITPYAEESTLRSTMAQPDFQLA